MPTSYSWDLVSIPLSGSVPNPGTYVPSTPGIGRDPRRDQFERGIKFGNVPGGRADFVIHGGPRVQHVNSVQTVIQETSDKNIEPQTYSGVVKFRFRDYRRFAMPDSVNLIEFRSSNRFTDPVFPFTGQYPADHIFFQVSSGSVAFQGSMNVRRSRYAAARLNDNRAIVAGGWDAAGVSGSSLVSTQIYNSGSGLWSTVASLPTPKNMHFGLLLSASGEFLVVGGSSGAFTDDVEGVRAYRYNTGSDTWTPTANSASVPRRDFEMVQIPDGRVFLPGGLVNSFTGSEFYDPVTDMFSGTAPIPLPPLNREAYTTTLLPDGTVLVCGGRDPIDLIPSRHSFRFYPTLQSWSIEPSMSVGRAGHEAVLSDGKVMVFGGMNPEATASFPLLLPGPLGGLGDELGATSAFEQYNPTERNWTNGPDMPVSRARFAVIGYNRDGGRGILLGGHTQSLPLQQTDIYVSEVDQWITSTPLLSGVFDITPVLLNPGDPTGELKILIPGGNLSGTVSFSGSQLYRTAG